MFLNIVITFFPLKSSIVQDHNKDLILAITSKIILEKSTYIFLILKIKKDLSGHRDKKLNV